MRSNLYWSNKVGRSERNCVRIEFLFLALTLAVFTAYGGNPKSKGDLHSTEPTPEEKQILEKHSSELSKYQLAFQSNRDGRWQIYVMNGDGGNQVRLTEEGGYHPKWSPNGNLIAYTQGIDLCLMEADGANKQKLVSSAYEPFWSPDGNRIGYSKGRPNAQGVLAFMDLETRKETVIRGNRFLQKSGGGAWSPDGKRIAFFSNVLGRMAMVMNADGTNAMPLIGKTNSCKPDWSPDGRKIAFVWAEEPGSFIETVNPDGSDMKQVTPEREYELWEYYPDWSPDGNWIAYAIGAENDQGGVWQIYAIPSTGGEPVRLTFEGGNSEPDWRPFPEKDE